LHCPLRRCRGKLKSRWGRGRRIRLVPCEVPVHDERAQWPANGALRLGATNFVPLLYGGEVCSIGPGLGRNRLGNSRADDCLPEGGEIGDIIDRGCQDAQTHQQRNPQCAPDDLPDAHHEPYLIIADDAPRLYRLTFPPGNWVHL
jgi:hypothetical protein